MFFNSYIFFQCQLGEIGRLCTAKKQMEKDLKDKDSNQHQVCYHQVCNQLSNKLNTLSMILICIHKCLLRL